MSMAEVEKPMSTLDAILLIEGGEASDAEIIEAFQVLVDDGIVWKLQGWYGRAASQMLDAGLLTRPE